MEHKNDYKKRKAGCLNKYFNLGTLWKEVPFVKVGNFNGSTQTQNYVVIIKIVSHMHKEIENLHAHRQIHK